MPVPADTGNLLNLTQPRVMGILNVTPDSFSDGGVFIAPDIAVAHAMEMVEQLLSGEIRELGILIIGIFMNTIR